MARTIDRKVAAATGGRGTLHAGVGVAGITPHFGLPLEGYSLSGQFARALQGRLWARAFYLEDAAGRCAAICVIDGHSASRWLLEKAASMTAPFGIDTRSLLLVGTHTHTGPGQYHACSFYDSLLGPEVGFDEKLANWLASRIAKAVIDAIGSARPAKVGFALESVWGASRNRSLPAFERNPEAPSWCRRGMPGQGAPRSARGAFRAVDPRVRVMAIVDAQSSQTRGLLATFACHGTALGPREAAFSADWAGYACQEARAAWKGDAPPLVAVALGGAGDQTPMPPDGAQGHHVAAAVAKKVSEALLRAGRAASRRASSALSVDVRYGESALSDREVEGDATTTLSTEPLFGVPALAGSEESRTTFYELGLAQEPRVGTAFASTDPQHPKEPAFGLVQQIAVGVDALRTSEVLPLHVLRLGRHALATVPGEPTVTAAYRIEQTLTAIDGIESVQVLGYGGDYLGYFTTEEEYDAQHYEGASTLYGRKSTRHLIARLARLASGTASTPFHPGPIAFEPGPPRQHFLGASTTSTVVPGSARVVANGTSIEVHWDTASDDRIVLGELDGFFVRLGQWDGSHFEPWLVGGRGLNDLEVPVRISTSPPGTLPQHWIVRLWPPDRSRWPNELWVQIAPIGRFAGFTLRVA